jgi:pyruvate, water dikinase
VSGVVEVDHVLVSKEGDLGRNPIRFQYRVGDKREQMVFDASTGQGTRRVDTLYHQRLRPALEYVELCELVRTSVALEEIYGHPLDLEFAFEGQDLRILQVRPIPLFHSLVAETLERFPFSARVGADSEA